MVRSLEVERSRSAPLHRAGAALPTPGPATVGRVARPQWGPGGPGDTHALTGVPPAHSKRATVFFRLRVRAGRVTRAHGAGRKNVLLGLAPARGRSLSTRLAAGSGRAGPPGWIQTACVTVTAHKYPDPFAFHVPGGGLGRPAARRQAACLAVAHAHNEPCGSPTVARTRSRALRPACLGQAQTQARRRGRAIPRPRPGPARHAAAWAVLLPRLDGHIRPGPGLRPGPGRRIRPGPGLRAAGPESAPGQI